MKLRLQFTGTVLVLYKVVTVRLKSHYIAPEQIILLIEEQKCC